MPALKNLRHERFCAAYVQGETAGNAAGSYRIATGHSQRSTACRLLQRADVQQRVAELLLEVETNRKASARIAVEQCAITTEGLIAEAEELRLLAIERGQVAAGVAALTAKAKLAGLWIERTDATVRQSDPNELSDAELAAIALGDVPNEAVH